MLNKAIRQPASITIALIILMASSVLPHRSAAMSRHDASRAKPSNQALSPLSSSRSLKQAAEGLPLYFESNQGQFDSAIKFVSRGSTYSVALSQSEAIIKLPDSQSLLRMRMVGGSAAAPLTGREELTARTNYLLGAASNRWRTSVPTYAKVEQRNVYAGIDLVYYGNRQRLEYDLVVAPGADPKSITMAFDGAERIRIDDAGDLVLSTPSGEVRQKRPFAYQEVGGERVEIAARYVLKGRHRVGFHLGPYDRHRKLVIDPILEYSSFLGVEGYGMDIAVDRSGNTYITGWVNNNNFPATPGAFSTTKKGSQDPADAFGKAMDVYVLKLNREGNAIIYATYLGGSNYDRSEAIAIDDLGNVYIGGSTSSPDFPTTPGSYKPGYGGTPCAGSFTAPCYEGFLTKLNASGSAIVYSTYIGGSQAEFVGDVAVDSSLNAYVIGETLSDDFPTTPGAFQASLIRGPAGPFNIDSDAFILKVNAEGSAALYSTLLGGSGGDAPSVGGHRAAIAVDAAGNAYVTGYTGSPDFPTTPGALKGTGGGDAFITKLNATGTALLYSTYLGGSGRDATAAIAIDAGGNAYVTGFTDSEDFPVKNAFKGESSVASLLKSDSKGESWTALKRPPVSQTLGETRSLKVAPDDPNVIYLGMEKGLFKSTDGGQSWAASGLSEYRVRRITIDERRPNTLYVTTLRFESATQISSSVFKSTDGGETWANILDAPTVTAVVVNPKDSSVIYASSESDWPRGGGGVFKSTDEGRTWANVTTGLDVIEQFIFDLAIDPDNPSTLYAASMRGVFKTTDAGASWKRAPLNKFILSLAIDPDNPSTLYASAEEEDDVDMSIGDPDQRFNPRRRVGVNADDTSARIFKSTNGGSSWESIMEGIDREEIILSFLIEPRSTSTIYALGSFDFYKTTNAGRTWAEVDTFPGKALAAAIAPQSSTLYVGIDFSFAQDAFVAKLNPSGTELVYSTYMGGTDLDAGRSIAVDAEGNAYVIGETESKNFHVTGNAFDKRHVGTRFYFDMFIAKLNSEGQPIFSSYMGGDDIENAGAVAIGPDGVANIVGSSASRDFPLSKPLRAELLGSLSVNTFVAKVNISASGAPRGPVINRVTISGKMLIVEGENFADGAVILVDGKQQKTANDPASAASRLMSKKAGKKVKRMPEARVQVRNPDGSVSVEYNYAQP